MKNTVGISSNIEKMKKPKCKYHEIDPYKVLDDDEDFVDDEAYE